MPKDVGPDTRGAGPELVLGRAIIKDYSDSRVLDRMMLYERRIENSLHKSTRELERRQVIRQYQQQESGQELSIKLAPSTAGGSITNLKKQTQFPVAHIVANSLKKGDYGNIPLRGAQENKPNQSQTQWDIPRGVPFDAVALPGGIGKREKSCSKLTG
jgi:hypothetical protein